MRRRAHDDGVDAEPSRRVGDLADRRVGPEEERRPPGHVEAVGDHAQAQVVPLLGRARQQHASTGRRCARFGLEHARIDDLDDGAHGRARQVLFPDGRLARLPGRAGVGQDASQHVAVQHRDGDLAAGDRLDGGPHRGRLVVPGQCGSDGVVEPLHAGIGQAFCGDVLVLAHRQASTRDDEGRNDATDRSQTIWFRPGRTSRLARRTARPAQSTALARIACASPPRRRPRSRSPGAAPPAERGQNEGTCAPS